MAVLGHTGKDHPCSGLISARGDRPPKFDSGRRTPLSCLPEEAVGEIIKTVKQNSKSSERMRGKIANFSSADISLFPRNLGK